MDAQKKQEILAAATNLLLFVCDRRRVWENQSAIYQRSVRGEDVRGDLESLFVSVMEIRGVMNNGRL